MDRRKFGKIVVSGAAALAIAPSLAMNGQTSSNGAIRLGAPLFEPFNTPDEWVALLKKYSYSAAYCPLGLGAPDTDIRAYEKAALKANIEIAEVGSWTNNLNADEKIRKENIEICKKSLALADNIGARCAVNISGTHNPQHWAGPHKNNLTPETFDLVVHQTREIIDAVKPVRTFYTIETMPWMYPDSVDSCLALIKAIDRKQFGIHFDAVNLMVSPVTYYGIGDITRDAFKRLGGHIKSCHGKDLKINEAAYYPQFEECIPGTGEMDYATYLTEISRQGNVSLMLEHLPKQEDFDQAAKYVRKVGFQQGLRFY
jgi:sugar phosphate isomerase/epimerase